MSGAGVQRQELGGLTLRARPVFGTRPTLRFSLAVTGTVAYVAFAVTVSRVWRSELERAIGPVMAWVIPIFMAYIPGVVIGFLCFTLVFTRYMPPPVGYAPPGPWPRGQWPAVTVIVAAYNEEKAIERTIDHIAASTYAGPVSVVLADNNSTDRTAQLAEAAARRHGLEYRRSFEPQAGKHHALNTALAAVTTPIVVTVDADTGLHPAALGYLISRLTSRPQDQHVCACAGALIVENATQNFLTRMQGWDYRLGINGVKRTQAAYNSALVAQGAFSAYWTEDVRTVGGWPDAIGEDIVLTWSLMSTRGLVQYEPAALADTAAPEQVRHFMRQRSRWARGMLEGVRINPPQRQPRALAKAVAGIDYLVPFLDIGYVFFWIPGVILFIFGYPLIFSWWSMLVIPITLVVYGILRRWQDRNVFRRLHVRPERDRRGFFGYLFAYQALVSTASLRGYAQHLRGSARRWK
ncbi:MAG: glycosyltransferase family 2 protein [Solirubrobacteraceae bacterium]